MLEKIKSFKWGYILLFLLLAGGGVCFLMFHETLSTIALAMGIILIIFGIIFGVVAIADKRRGGGFAVKMVFAVIAIACGIITAVVHKTDAIEHLASLFGLLLIIDGSFKLHTAAMSKRYKLISWWLVLVPAVLVIIGGFVSLEINPASFELPEDGETAVSIAIGVTMIVDAISNFLSAFYVSAYERGMKRDIIEEYMRITTSPTLPEEKTAEVEAPDDGSLPEAQSFPEARADGGEEIAISESADSNEAEAKAEAEVEAEVEVEADGGESDTPDGQST